ncbi:hypothetical protein PLICRDRAFT_39258 [Plicaturopsis crispa FD-325 SS-3]|nr:hypothetical protein PLICRDRAFT_39258 [Plicaturopsis crispa FD-325 SS-3]
MAHGWISVYYNQREWRTRMGPPPSNSGLVGAWVLQRQLAMVDEGVLRMDPDVCGTSRANDVSAEQRRGEDVTQRVRHSYNPIAKVIVYIATYFLATSAVLVRISEFPPQSVSPKHTTHAVSAQDSHQSEKS